MWQATRLMKVVFCEPEQAFREIVRVNYPGREGERIVANPSCITRG
jgi:hypothetical protein